MVFSGITFLIYFMPVFFLIYYLLPHKYKNGWVLISSLLFFSWGAPVFIFTVVGSCIIDYYLASKFSSTNRKLFFVTSIALNLILLAYFKYANFFIDNFNFISSTLTGDVFSFSHILLPVGISFLIFHKISFLYDVYRKETEYPSRFSDYLLFIMLFPHLIAGPIVRFKEILPQIKSRTQYITWADTYYGFMQFIIGLSKKVLIANVLGEYVNESLEKSVLDFQSAECWIIIIAYTFQLYFDFSGYSDMAIGMARMMGFQFPENFNFPYTSKGITEFWKRWHITLGSWMRDYLYIPLGGNKGALSKTYINLFLVFFLSGLWHGASWNFVVWGLYHGAFLVIERMWLGNLLRKIPSFLSTLYAFLVVVTGWVFFRLESFDDSIQFIKRMFSFNPDTYYKFTSPEPKFILVLVIAIVFSFPPASIQKKLTSLYTGRNQLYMINTAMALLIVVLYIFNLGELYATGFNPFIYFKF